VRYEWITEACLDHDHCSSGLWGAFWFVSPCYWLAFFVVGVVVDALSWGTAASALCMVGVIWLLKRERGPPNSTHRSYPPTYLPTFSSVCDLSVGWSHQRPADLAESSGPMGGSMAMAGMEMTGNESVSQCRSCILVGVRC
jgi:hypothetical protein